MTDEIDRAREALAETDRIFEQITRRGRTPPLWFVDYRVRLRLLIAGAAVQPVEAPAQLRTGDSERVLH